MTAKVVNSHTEKYDVFIGRPSKFGNPYSHLPNSAAPWPVETREDAIRLYEEWIRSQPELMAAAKKELKGKVLGCPGLGCPYLGCHGDVLLKIANEEDNV